MSKFRYGSLASAIAQRSFRAAYDPFFHTVSALLHFDGADGSTTIVDSGPRALPFLATGGAQLKAAKRKFGPTALDANAGGTPGQVSCATPGPFQLGSGDFTIEAWPYSADWDFGSEKAIAGVWAAGGYSWYCGVDPSGKMCFYYSTSGSSGTAFLVGTNLVPAAAPVHLAWCRQGSTLRFFVNGKLDATHPIGSVTFFNSTALFTVGASDPNLNAGNEPIDEVRVTKGYARYIENFTPPSEPYPDLADNAYDPYWYGVKALLHFDGADGSTTITDSGPLGLTFTASGGAQIKATNAKFGSGALDANAGGSPGLVSCTASSNFWFGQDDFTIEAWPYSADWVVGDGKAIVGLWAAGGFSWYFFVDTNGKLSLAIGDSGGLYSGAVVSNAVVTGNKNSHLACVREGDYIKLFIDGNLDITQFIGTGFTFFNSTAPLTIGGHSGTSDVGGEPIDEVRITKGVARYTNSFTPPTSPFPNTGLASVETSYSNPLGRGDRSASITVTSDLTAGSGTPQSMVNGNRTENAYYFTGGQSGKHIKFDFGSGVTKKISGFTFTQELTSSHGVWKWQTSSDDVTWTDHGAPFIFGGSAVSRVKFGSPSPAARYHRMLQVSGVTGAQTWNREIEFEINAVSARYWRVLCQTTPSITGSSASEIQMRDISGGSNVATGGTAAASSVFSGYPASDAFDGNNATFWSSNGGGEQWISYDFGAGSVKTIRELVWRARSDDGAQSPTAFKVQCSDNGSAWTDVASFSGLATWSNGETRTFTVQ